MTRAGLQETAGAHDSTAVATPRRESRRTTRSRNRGRYRRWKLYAMHPYCFWCGKLTFFTTTKGEDRSRFATVDHWYTRRERDKRVLDRGMARVVLACYGCNHARGNRTVQEWCEYRGLPVLVAPWDTTDTRPVSVSSREKENIIG